MITRFWPSNTRQLLFFLWFAGLGSCSLVFGLRNEHLLWSQTLTRSHSCCVVFTQPKQAYVSYVSRNSARILRFAAKHCQCNHEITSIGKFKHKNVVSHQKTSVRNGSDGKPNHISRFIQATFGDSRRCWQLSQERNLGADLAQLIHK